MPIPLSPFVSFPLFQERFHCGGVLRMAMSVKSFHAKLFFLRSKAYLKRIACLMDG